MTPSIQTVDSAQTNGSTVTLQRLRVLESLYEHGYHDDVVDLTIQKLLTHQIQKEESQQTSLKNELVTFEQNFHMTSEEFEAKYQRGEMGDDADIFEWHTLYIIAQRLQQRLTLLKNNQFGAMI